MRIKICGLRNESDIEIMNKYMPDYVGFVFAPSKRRLSGSKAKELAQMLDVRIKRVGVFVNEEPKRLADIAMMCGLYAVQLHGDEDEGYISEISASTGLKIIKCIRTKDEESILSTIETEADYILFDSYSRKERGGTGKSADWSLIAKVRDKIEKPFFLAGGINISNLSAACAIKPYALDVSSGVEAADGKDALLVGKLINELHRS